MLSFLLRGSRSAVLLKAALMIGVIAFVDWRVEKDLPLGFLYLFPMLLVGSVLNRWQIVAVAACCTFLTELFDSFEWRPEAGVPRDILIFAAFAGMGLFVFEIVRSRQITLQHLDLIQNESEARRAAEEQLQVLVETSPAAIFTIDSAGFVLLANDAAHRLLALTPGTLPGKSIRDYLPSLVNVPAPDDSHPSFRTVMQCRGQRQDGEAFLADIWFSTYRTSVGSRLAAMVVDTSEDLRTREEFSLHQLLAASRILVGAVSHEVRNVCGAIAVVHENLEVVPWRKIRISKHWERWSWRSRRSLPWIYARPPIKPPVLICKRCSKSCESWSNPRCAKKTSSWDGSWSQVFRRYGPTGRV